MVVFASSAPFIGALPALFQSWIDSEDSWLFLDELDAAVLRAAFVRGVGSNRLVGTLADGGQAGPGNALFDQGVHDGLGPLLAQRIIDLVGAGRVAVALNLEFEFRVLLHQRRQTEWIIAGVALALLAVIAILLLGRKRRAAHKEQAAEEVESVKKTDLEVTPREKEILDLLVKFDVANVAELVIRAKASGYIE